MRYEEDKIFLKDEIIVSYEAQIEEIKNQNLHLIEEFQTKEK